MTLEKLMEGFEKCYTPTPASIRTSTVFNITEWLIPHLNTIKNHSKPHIFKIAKDDNGRAKNFWKEWSTDKTLKATGEYLLKTQVEDSPDVVERDYTEIQKSSTPKQNQILRTVRASLISAMTKMCPPVIIGKACGPRNSTQEIQVDDFVLVDIPKYAGDWLQVCCILSIDCQHVTVRWYKGSKTTAWTPCTRRGKDARGNAGFGVFATQSFMKGEFLLGDRLTPQEAEQRREKGRHNYMFYFTWNGKHVSQTLKGLGSRGDNTLCLLTEARNSTSLNVLIIQNLIQELPHHVGENNKQDFLSFSDTTIGNKNQIKGSDARLYVVKLAKFSIQKYEEGKITESIPNLVNSLVDIVTICYSDYDTRSPKQLLRLYNQCFVFGLLCNHLERIADFVLPGKNVWWSVDAEDGMIFHDGPEDDERRPDGPQLHHFRSRSLKEERMWIKQKWQECLHHFASGELQLPFRRLKTYEDGKIIYISKGTKAHEQYTGLMAEQNEESGVRLGPDQEPDGGSLEPLDDGKCLEDKNYASKKRYTDLRSKNEESGVRLEPSHDMDKENEPLEEARFVETEKFLTDVSSESQTSATQSDSGKFAPTSAGCYVRNTLN
uniref:DUF7869 domain-containing protein n=1 Tax=Magallana gigas TaxID=29159 RepID=K1PE89_MAGGI